MFVNQPARAAMIAALSFAWPASSAAVTFWNAHHGATRIALNRELLESAGLTISCGDPGAGISTSDVLIIDVAQDPLPLVMNPQFLFDEGLIRHASNVLFARNGRNIATVELDIALAQKATPSTIGLSIDAPALTFDPFRRMLAIASDDVTITPRLAEVIGAPQLAGVSIGPLTTEVFLAWSGGDLPPTARTDDDPLPRACATPNPGPDVIVGDIQGINSYSNVDGVVAFSIGTYACNIGDAPVRWQGLTNLHPVIPQSLYRYKIVDGAGRFEQIGIGWCKHAFTAFTDSLCCQCTGPGGAQLGVGCADPYTSARNGVQLSLAGGLGPRFDVNPHTGVFTFPYPFQNTNGSTALTSITRRVQVDTTDLDPAQNVGADYFAEAQYVTQDDAASDNAGTWSHNQDNNCSYRKVAIEPSGSNYVATFLAQPATVRTYPAIKAWHAIDPNVAEAIINTPEEELPAGSGNNTGRLFLCARSTDLGAGLYRYEYALFNMNSDRGIKSFSVPVSDSLPPTNIGFHGVAHHSGDGFGSTPGNQINFDATDWPATHANGALRWEMPPATPYKNSNALRWGTLYNFRFDAPAPPATGDARLDLFKPVPGLSDTVTADTVIPSVPCTVPIVAAIADATATCLAPWKSPAPSATGGVPPYAWSLDDASPPGMTIDAATGIISWPRPLPSSSAWSITIQASSSGSCGSSAATFLLAVRCNLAPRLNAPRPNPG